MSGRIDGPPASAMNIPIPATDTLAQQGGFAQYPPNKPDTTPGSLAQNMPGQANINVGMGK